MLCLPWLIAADKMKKSQQKRERSEKAFTLVEMLTAVAILAVLAGLALLAMGGVRSQADRAETISNMRQIYTAIQAYSAENGGKLVPVAYQNAPTYPPHWIQTLYEGGYLNGQSTTVTAAEEHLQQSVYESPRVTRFFGEAMNQKTSIAMNVRLGYRANPRDFTPVGRFQQADDLTRTVLLMEAFRVNAGTGPYLYPNFWPSFSPSAEQVEAFEDRFPLLFLDGHIETLSAGDIPFADETPGENRLFWRGKRL